jgi:hypothetical protein
MTGVYKIFRRHGILLNSLGLNEQWPLAGAARLIRNHKTYPYKTIHHKNIMVFSMGVPVRLGLVRFFMLSAMIILIIPVSCMASTPPIQPSLLVKVSNNSADQNASFSLLFTWNGYVSYNIPPGYIIVEIVSMKDGSRLGKFSVPRQNDVCEAENICTYNSSVNLGILPPGEFMLVAYDPLSGATVRDQITISSHKEGNKNFFDRSEREQAFFLVSGILAVFLVAILAILIRNKKR